MNTLVLYGAIAAALVALGYIVFKMLVRQARARGASEARSDGLEDAVKKGKKHHALKSNASRWSNSDLAARLRRWERK